MSNKTIVVNFIGPSKEKYAELNNLISDEIKCGKIGTYNQKLWESIDRTVNFLSKDPAYGINIPKRLIPNYYYINFNVNNLRKCNLFDYWRFIYSLRSDENSTFVDVLEFMDHKEYDRRFGYHS